VARSDDFQQQQQLEFFDSGGSIEQIRTCDQSTGFDELIPLGISVWNVEKPEISPASVGGFGFPIN
jgi:hypothetical protein